MDIRFLIVGTPFIISFLYTLFWIIRWGALNSSSNNNLKKMNTKNDWLKGNLTLENIFLTKN